MIPFTQMAKAGKILVRDTHMIKHLIEARNG